MTTIPIPAGPTNKEIIDLAYLGLGVSDAMFGRTDDEYASGMVLLRAMMGEYPFNQLGYDTTEPRLNERSGIEAQWLTAVGYGLSGRIASASRQPLPATTARDAAVAFSKMAAAVHMMPAVQYAEGTPAGAGNKWPFDTFAGEAFAGDS